MTRPAAPAQAACSHPPRMMRAAALACALAAGHANAFPVRIMEIPAVRTIETPVLRAPEVPARPLPDTPHDLASPDTAPTWRPAPLAATPAPAPAPVSPSTPPPSTDVRDPRGMPISAAGFIVTGDGVVVASHQAISRCARIDAVIAHRRVPTELVAQEGDVTLLRIAGGPFPRLLPRSSAAALASDVTLLGVRDSHWKVAAGDLLPAGANADDEGWPQVRTQATAAPTDGAVWAADGGVAGIAIDMNMHRTTNVPMLRFLPAPFLQSVLERHGIAWKADGGLARPDVDAAMRRALAATVPLVCS